MHKAFTVYAAHITDPKTQSHLNEPLKEGGGLKKEHEAFLKNLIEKIETNKLDPLSARTLYNMTVYEKLSETDQERADLTAINIMGIIRQIKILWELDHKETFQIKNLVETVFRMKSGFEEKHGDVYII
jgi:hypothetical protein